MTDTTAALRIERATERDVPLILRLIKELAVYGKRDADANAPGEGPRGARFGARPAAEVIIARVGDTPAGFALFFHNYSTFLGKPGLYLEDLFVVPDLRGRGYGREFLQPLARIAVERGCGRFEWSVLDWNEPAIGFYKKLGARPMDGWTIFRVTGDALAALAATAPAGQAPRSA